MVEMLVVLAIIGILAMVAAPNFQNKSKTAVRGTLEGLVSILSEGRQLARTTGQRVTLHVQGSASPNLALALEYVDPCTKATVVGGGLAFNGLDSAIRAYSAIGVGDYQIKSVAPDMTNLKKMPLVTNWKILLDYSNALFQGGDGTAYSFDASGQPSGDFFVTVSSPEADANSPFGLLVVTRDNGVHAFMKTTPADAWRAL